MSDIQHKDIPEAQLHEPKGVSTAADGRVYVANGAGTGSWIRVPDSSIDSEVSPSGAYLESGGGGVATFTKRIFRYTVSISPALVAANTSAEQTFTVSGLVAATDELLSVIKPTHQAGLLVGNCRVSADNQIAIQFANITGSSITPTASESYSIYAWRR